MIIEILISVIVVATLFALLYSIKHPDIRYLAPLQPLINGKIKRGLASINLVGTYKDTPVEIRWCRDNGAEKFAIRIYHKFPVMTFYLKTTIAIFDGFGQKWIPKNELKDLGLEKYKVICKDPHSAKNYLTNSIAKERVASLINKVLDKSFPVTYLLRLTNSYGEVYCSFVGLLSNVASKKLEDFMNVPVVTSILDDFIELKSLAESTAPK